MGWLSTARNDPLRAAIEARYHGETDSGIVSRRLVADDLGISEGTLSEWLAGRGPKSKTPSELVLRAAEVLRCDPTVIMRAPVEGEQEQVLSVRLHGRQVRELEAYGQAAGKLTAGSLAAEILACWLVSRRHGHPS